MTEEEVREALKHWRENDDQRDGIVRAANQAGVSKHAIHVITGLARTTIDRILDTQEQAMPFQPMKFGTPGTSRPKGKCPKCGKQVAIVPNGRLNSHGPRSNRCQGSGNYPMQGRG